MEAELLDQVTKKIDELILNQKKNKNYNIVFKTTKSLQNFHIHLKNSSTI